MENKNLILFGPSGVGKSKIVDNAILKLKDKKQITNEEFSLMFQKEFSLSELFPKLRATTIYELVMSEIHDDNKNIY